VTSNELLNLTTATKANALTPEERHEFLAEKRVGRLGTNRGDGWSHVTPIWYVWENRSSISRSATADGISGTSRTTRT
jgi:nitroimidazol reductase NimA-like FMN-containing flavoprotein (pyridoxamine 5'-phosphate oxidase superfamily)